MKDLITLVVTLTVVVLVPLATADVPQMMNYQGRLTDSLTGEPLDTTVSMTFTIYDDTTGGVAWWTESQDSVTVSNGLFNVLLGTVNPLPDTVFGGDERWLQITVESEDITPRTRLITVPYAYRAAVADSTLLGGSSNWTVTDSVLYTNNYWGIARGGASNLLLGDSVHTIVNLGVACTTGTVIGGEWQHHQTICGGYGNTVSSNFTTIGGGYINIASASGATVGGGTQNTASQIYGTVAGGLGNTASGVKSTVGGGEYNQASGSRSCVNGGALNTASGLLSAVGGGRKNLVAGDYAAVLGGFFNTIDSSADYSYLFGISSTLGEDSTFMVDMPHIRFGDEATGYEFPTADGSAGQVMATDGSGKVSWNDAFPSPGIAYAESADSSSVTIPGQQWTTFLHTSITVPSDGYIVVNTTGWYNAHTSPVTWALATSPNSASPIWTRHEDHGCLIDITPVTAGTTYDYYVNLYVEVGQPVDYMACKLVATYFPVNYGK